MGKSELHIISHNGQKKVVPFIEDGPLSEDINGDLLVDDEWYLTHGYVTLEQHKAHLNNEIARKTFAK